MAITERDAEIIERGFCLAYDRLVADEHDFLGMVAYSAYKTHKRKFVVQHGCPRQDPRINSWNQDFLSTPRELYQDNARKRLKAFADTLLKEAYHDLRTQAFDEFSERFSNRKSFTIGVLSSVTATLAVGLMTVLGIAAYTGVNPVYGVMQAVVTAHPTYVEPAAGPDDGPAARLGEQQPPGTRRPGCADPRTCPR